MKQRIKMNGILNLILIIKNAISKKICSMLKKRTGNSFSINIELIGIIIIFLLGALSIWGSISVNVDLNQRLYEFELKMPLKTNTEGHLNYFLWKHNFSENKGEISFTIKFNESVDYIELHFPSTIEDKKTDIYFLKCNELRLCQNKINYEIKTNFKIVNSTRTKDYTMLTISNLPNTLENHKIVIEYYSRIKPKGIFNIFHPYNRLYYSQYAIDFDIGENYDCIGECFIKDASIGIEPYYLGGVKEIKLKFDKEYNNEVRFHRFKLNAVDKTKLFFKDILFGLGISFLASSIILLFNYIVSRIKNKQIIFNFRLLRKLIKVICRKLK